MASPLLCPSRYFETVCPEVPLRFHMALAVYPPSPLILRYSRELTVKGASAPPFYGGLPLTDGLGCAISRRRGGGYILQSRPLSHDWERAGGLGCTPAPATEEQYELYEQPLREDDERTAQRPQEHHIAKSSDWYPLQRVSLLAGNCLCFLL